jgi:hypothetical protein
VTIQLLLAATVLMQQVPTVALGQPDARSSDGFTSIFAVHELEDGRVLVTDNLDNAIRLVDLRAGTVRELGRRGQGPLEYQSAHTILRGRGDTVLVTDNVQRRFVKLVNGEIVATAQQPDVLRSLSSFSAPITDARGRLHFDVRTIDMSADGFHERDGVVIRWTPGSTRLDTVAILRVTSHAPRANAGYNPFRYRDAWGLAPDGAIAVVSTEPYRVEWVAVGRRMSGSPIPYDRVRIDGDERNAEREAFSRRSRGGVRFRGPPQARRSRDPQLRQSIPDDVFPPYKPPFTESRVLVSPAGEVWIPRAAPWNAEQTIVDVAGRDAILRRHVTVPANTRIVGFGRGTVYVAVTDEYDLQWLERITYP